MIRLAFLLIMLGLAPAVHAQTQPDAQASTRNLKYMLQELEAGEFVALDLTFKTNSAELSEGQEKRLDDLANLLATPSLAGYRMAIYGHTDAAGSEAYNMTLSRQRADAVAAAMLARGIAQMRLDVQGFGESQLKLPDQPLAQANRRVEIKRLEVMEDQQTSPPSLPDEPTGDGAAEENTPDASMIPDMDKTTPEATPAPTPEVEPDGQEPASEPQQPSTINLKQLLGNDPE